MGGAVFPTGRQEIRPAGRSDEAFARDAAEERSVRYTHCVLGDQPLPGLLIACAVRGVVLIKTFRSNSSTVCRVSRLNFPRVEEAGFAASASTQR